MHYNKDTILKFTPPSMFVPRVIYNYSEYNPEDLIGVIKYNIDHFQNKDILFLTEGLVNNNLGYFILELGLVVKNTDSFAYYTDYLRDKIIKHNEPDISENHNIEGSKFPFWERLIPDWI